MPGSTGPPSVVAGKGHEGRQAGVAVEGRYTSQNHGAVRTPGIGQGLAALDDAAVGYPALAPDERAVLVGASGHVAPVRSDPVGAAGTQQAGEDGWIRPRGKAHPRTLTVWIRQDPTLAVGQEGVIAQFVWERVALRGTRRARRVSICQRRLLRRAGLLPACLSCPRRLSTKQPMLRRLAGTQ